MTNHEFFLTRVFFFVWYIFRYLFAFRGRRGDLLDVGSGYGHFCSVSKFFGNKCYAIEPRAECEKSLLSKNIEYIFIGDIKEFSTDKKFDLVSIITVLDECNDKENFLLCVTKLINEGATIYIEVRNLEYILRPNKGLPTDIKYYEYLDIFNKLGFKVIKTTGWARPISFGSPIVFVKTLVSNALFFLPWRKKQMIGFVLEFSSS